MKFLKNLRTSSALRVSPIAIAIVLFYYFTNDISTLPNYGYAPTVVANAIGPMGRWAWAAAAMLGVWEMGRFKASDVRESPLLSRRFQVMACAAVPILLLTWLMLILPVALALFQTGIAPTIGSLIPLGQEMIICVAYVVTGFGVGYWVPRRIATPLIGGLVYYFVVYSVTSYSFWWRHLTGNYFDPVMFGELPTPSVVLTPLLFIGSIALAFALGWSPLKPLMLRYFVAVLVVSSGTLGSYVIVKNWGSTMPVMSVGAPMKCAGKAPKVCMPAMAAEKLDFVRTEAASVVHDLSSAGAVKAPVLITDRMADGREQKLSTESTWRASLSDGAAVGDVRYRIAMASLRFRCTQPDFDTGNALALWTATQSGERAAFVKRLDAWVTGPGGDAERVKRIVRQVDEVRSRPKGEQVRWYQQSVSTACKEKK